MTNPSVGGHRENRLLIALFYWARSDNKKLLYHVYYNTNRCTHNPKICVCVDQIW